jgi:predicted transposase YbfD/YdcC
MEQFKEIIEESFLELDDYRRAEGQRHPFINLIVMSVCAVIANADSESDIAIYAEEKREWFEQFLDLKHGTPSEPTFRRFLTLVDSKQLEKCFIEFTRKLTRGKNGNHIAIDGKTICSSYDKDKNTSPIHMLSALATEYGLTLAQIKTDSKSNEITAIPEMLEMLDLKETVVSMDAIGTQKAIAKQIRKKEGDYVLALKSNHPTFYDEVEDFFTQSLKNEFKNTELMQRTTIDKGHGRIEERKYYICSSDYDCISEKGKWEGIKSIIYTTTTRKNVIEDKTSMEGRYFISSLDMEQVDKIVNSIRSHWSIENSLHYILDVTFGEDGCRARAINVAENFSVMRRLALNILKSHKSKESVKRRRYKASLNNAFMEELLLNSTF